MQRTTANIVVECPQRHIGSICHNILARRSHFTHTLKTVYNDPKLTLSCYLPDPMQGVIFVVMTTYNSWCIDKLHSKVLEHVNNVVSDVAAECPYELFSVVSRANQSRTEQIYAVGGRVSQRVVPNYTTQFQMDMNDFPSL